MSDPSLFRPAVQPETTSDSPPYKRPDETMPNVEAIETPVSLRREMGKEPYLMNLVKSPDGFKHFGMREKINEIDSFIISEIKRHHLKDDKETYEKVSNKYFSQVQDKDIYGQVEDVHHLIQLEQKLLLAIEERERLLGADYLTLDSDTLKRRLKLEGISHV